MKGDQYEMQDPTKQASRGRSDVCIFGLGGVELHYRRGNRG